MRNHTALKLENRSRFRRVLRIEQRPAFRNLPTGNVQPFRISRRMALVRAAARRQLVPQFVSARGSEFRKQRSVILIGFFRGLRQRFPNILCKGLTGFIDDTGLKKGSKSLPIDREVAYMDRSPFRHFTLDFRFCGSVVFGRQQRGARGKAQSLNRGACDVQ